MNTTTTAEKTKSPSYAKPINKFKLIVAMIQGQKITARGRQARDELITACTSIVPSSTNVRLSEKVWSTLFSASRMATDVEWCFLLFGEPVQQITGEPCIQIEGVRRIANRARTRGRFLVSRSAVDRIVHSEPTALIGLFHTHRQANRPSQDDLAQMRRDGLCHLIGSPVAEVDCPFAAFRATDSGFVEYPVFLASGHFQTVEIGIASLSVESSYGPERFA